MSWRDLEATHSERAALTDDLRAMALAHAALDELGVPGSNDSGKRLTLFGRIEALRAGKFDPSRLTVSLPARSSPLFPCPRCGLLALADLGDVCPSCSAALQAAPA